MVKIYPFEYLNGTNRRKPEIQNICQFGFISVPEFNPSRSWPGGKSSDFSFANSFGIKPLKSPAVRGECSFDIFP